MESEPKLRGAGGTSGGVGKFLGGLAMAVAGAIEDFAREGQRGREGFVNFQADGRRAQFQSLLPSLAQV